MKQSLTSPTIASLQQSLEHLYEQRTAVQGLIDSLEEYGVRYGEHPTQEYRAATAAGEHRLAS